MSLYDLFQVTDSRTVLVRGKDQRILFVGPLETAPVKYLAARVIKVEPADNIHLSIVVDLEGEISYGK